MVERNLIVASKKIKTIIMNLEQTLTKENFFNEMMEKYPKATKHFCDWIDEYKKAVDWGKLFNKHYYQTIISRAANGEISGVEYSTPKFHDLPYAMQYGIWTEYCRQKLGDFFEQAEHYSSQIDLAEDIKNVFAETEELIATQA